MRVIIREPDNRLRMKARRINKVTPQIRILAKEMIDTMRNSKRPGIGLAGPQVGESLRIIVIAVGEENLVMINPRITNFTGEAEMQEGCLSVPGLYAKVIRATTVSFEYINLKGKKVVGNDNGIFARVLQHEIDHLDGKLFIDYLTRDTEIELEDGAKIPMSLVERLREDEDDSNN